MPERFRGPVLDRLIDQLSKVRASALELEHEHAHDLALVPEPCRPSARNLVRYLALRRHDLRSMQRELSKLGLSSLGRMESHVLPGLDAVLLAVHRLAGRSWDLDRPPEPPLDPILSRTALDVNAERLLGPDSSGRGVRIMVTMPDGAERDGSLVRSLLTAGMDVARINAAQGDADTWTAIAANVRRAEAETGRSCKILLDLAGPKLRTCALGEGPRVVRVRPRRDARGRVLERTSVRLVAIGEDLPPSTIPITASVVNRARVGDQLVVDDANGRLRRLKIIARTDGAVIAEVKRTVRFESGRRVRLLRHGKRVSRGEVGPLPQLGVAVRVMPDDELILMGADVEPRMPTRRENGELVEPAIIPTTFGDALGAVHVGAAIRFDDGKIGGVVEEVLPEGLRVQVRQVAPGGVKLRADKGVNLPDSDLMVECPTPKDLADLDFAIAHADMVGMSFVQRPSDLLRLEDELAARGADRLGIVLKIETQRAFENLPQLLLTGLRSPPVGVMVARGDLAVEVGFARLAEVQEEILWLCEAAHVPVIWATQVLESLAKRGLPSRAELSDAAMGVRAECVMLNKGPFIADAVQLLGDVLLRMRTHHVKKRSMLRELQVSWLGAARPPT